MSPGAPSATTSPRGDRRREAILTALDERLRTTALDDISVADLTEAAGITRSAFYFYFESKAAAVSTLLYVMATESRTSTEMIVNGTGDIRSRVRAAIDLLIDRVLENAHIYRALLTARTQHAPTRDMWDAGRRATAAQVAEFITAERAAGRAPEGIDATALAEGVVHINESVLERLVYNPDTPREPVLSTAADIWVRAVYGRVDPTVDASPDATSAAAAATATASTTTAEPGSDQ